MYIYVVLAVCTVYAIYMVCTELEEMGTTSPEKIPMKLTRRS